jgi:integrase/recombinase XerD
MDQTICPSHSAGHHQEAPFADERDRYLRHCAEHGATPASLRVKRNELLWLATRLDADAHEGIGIEVLQRMGELSRG